MKVISFLLLILMVTGFSSCLEEINLQSEISFENILVVEATITDKFGLQEINLSRSFPLEVQEPTLESGAEVKIINNDNSNAYLFQEIQPGRYVSNEPFAAIPNIEYNLIIITSDGKVYNSVNEVLNGTSTIDDLSYNIGLNESGEAGIFINVTPVNAAVSPKFYRFTYEETYKIIAPLYSPFELIPNVTIPTLPLDLLNQLGGAPTISEVIDYLVTFQPRLEQEQVCYNTVASKNIILAQTDGFENAQINEQPIRFLNKNDYIISHRYSILVSQYGQSLEASNFYRVLKDISTSEDLFSTLQTGFFSGNVFALNNPDEKVAGFFEVSSVDSKRLYFNYSDVFPNEGLPPYAIECDDFLTPNILTTDGDGNIVGSPLVQDLANGQQYYFFNGFEENESLFEVTPFTLVLQECGDCSVLGNNTPPDFWIE